MREGEAPPPGNPEESPAGLSEGPPRGPARSPGPGSGSAPVDPALLARIHDGVRARRAEWVTLVEALASLESPTADPQAQPPVQALLAGRFRALGLQVRRAADRPTGGTLLAAPPHLGKGAVQLLLGHTDTVWPRGTLREMPVRIEGTLLHGPGVLDMKGGLAHLPVALAVLADLGIRLPFPPVILLNSDEEIGSPASTPRIHRWARRAARVYVLEPALGPEGRLKTSRKGAAWFRVTARGRSAHAGLAPDMGANAILELSHVVQALHALNDPERGIQVNVGRVLGGTGANVVAAEAVAEVDVRVNTAEEAARVHRRLRELQPVVSGCTLEVEAAGGRPPFEPTPESRALWEAARTLATALGVPVDEGRAGGTSDGNTTQGHAPTLDGLGAVGDGAHASHEHLDIDRSLDRCTLLAALLALPHLELRDP